MAPRRLAWAPQRCVLEHRLLRGWGCGELVTTGEPHFKLGGLLIS